MIKISRVEAYQSFDENDFAVMDDEVHLCFNSDQRNDRKQTEQFYMDENLIMLVIYWDGVAVHKVSFENRMRLSKSGKERLAKVRQEQKTNEGEIKMTIADMNKVFNVEEVAGEDVKMVAGLDKAELLGRVLKLDEILGSFEVHAETIENIDIELGRIAIDVSETNPGDLEALGLLMWNHRNLIGLLSSLLTYTNRDLKAAVRQLEENSSFLRDLVRSVE